MNWTRILPPSGEEGVVAWRWCIAVVVILLLANGLSGRGFLGFGQFAYAEEVAEQAEKLDMILELQIVATLRALQAELCRANGSKPAIQQTIDRYQQQMRTLTGERYPLDTDCQEDTT